MCARFLCGPLKFEIFTLILIQKAGAGAGLGLVWSGPANPRSGLAQSQRNAKTHLLVAWASSQDWFYFFFLPRVWNVVEATKPGSSHNFHELAVAHIKGKTMPRLFSFWPRCSFCIFNVYISGFVACSNWDKL